MLPRLLLPHVSNIACFRNEAHLIRERAGVLQADRTFSHLHAPTFDVLPMSSSRQLVSRYCILPCDEKAERVSLPILSDKLDR